MSNIISISINNFRSYKNNTEFSFEAIDSDLRKGNYHDVQLANGNVVRLLNSAVIYGANAAGKSNVVIALLAISSFIRTSKRYDPEDKIKYEPYLFSPEKRNAPIEMSVRFIADKKVYDYCIKYTHKAFIYEQLRMADSEEMVFERGEDGVTHFNQEFLPGFAAENYLVNHLAMSELSLKAHPLLQAIYKELASIKAVPLTDEYRMGDSSKETAKLLHDEPDGSFTTMIKELITSADTGIIDVKIEEVDEKKFTFLDSFPDLKSRIISENKYEINMVHPSEDGCLVDLPLRVESAGTKTLFTAGTRVLKALQEGSFLAYDEMNIALHPMLFRRLVELFNNEVTNPNSAQLLL